MTVALDIQAPSFHKPILSGSESRVALLHARADGRFYEAAIARALADASTGRTVVVVTPDAMRARFLLEQWTKELRGSKRQTLTSDELKLVGKGIPGGAVVWVASGLVTAKTLPIRNPDHVICLDSHRLELNPLVGRRRTYLGEMPEGGHWFYTLTHDDPSVQVTRVPIEDILAVYPEEEDDLLPESDPAWERVMQVRDVPIKLDDRSLSEFCHDRLFVKSDKPVEFLTPRQKAAAKDQLSQKQRVIPFDIHAGQQFYLQRKRQLLEERGGKPWFIVLKSRRIGITAIEQALSYRIASTQPMSDVATLAHKWESTQRIFGMVSMFHQLDPQAVALRSKGSKSALQFANGSNFFIGTAGGEGFLRGEGVARVHWSEVSKSCRGPKQMTKVEDLWSGISGAASHGTATLETTANGKEWFYQKWQEAKQGLNEFKPIFLRWFDDPLNRLQESEFNREEILDELTDEEALLVQEHGLDLSQIAFRRQQKRVYSRLFPQEMPEDDIACFISSGVCFFDTDTIGQLLEKLRTGERAEKRRQIEGGYEVRWREPVAGRKYVMGVDTSEGVPGGDRSGAGVLDKETGEQVASIHGYFRPRLLADHVVRLAKDYNDALLGIERQNHGHAVLEKVQDYGVPFNRPHFRGGSLYYYIKGESLKASRAGWSTDGQHRAPMLDDLADAVQQGWMKIHDEVFVDEMGAFNLQPNGKFEADPASHDDAVMKWAIAWQMRKIHIPKPTITVL